MSTPWIVMVSALWAVVALVSIVMLGILARLTRLEAQLSTSSATEVLPSTVPALGKSLVELLDGAPPLLEPVTAAVLLFLSPTCAPCRYLGDELTGPRGARQGHDAQSAQVIVVTDAAQPPVYRAEGAIDRVVVQPPDKAFNKLFGIAMTPFGLAIDTEGVVCAAGVVNSLADVEALAARTSMAGEPNSGGTTFAIVR
jgi:hypothetical protein